MLLNYHGREISIAECRQKLGIGRDGAKASALARTARDYGMRVKAYSLDLRDMPDVPLPAILFWEFNHFVVLEKWQKDKVIIVDPAIGTPHLNKRTVRPKLYGRRDGN